VSRATLLVFAVAASGCASLPPPPKPAPRAVLEAHARDVHVLAFSANGALFASAGSGADPAVDEITLWTTETGARRMTFATYKGVAASLAFSPDGTLLAVGGTDGRIALLEVDSGAERISFAGRHGRVEALVFSYDGLALVSVLHSEGDPVDVEVCRWDVLRGVPRETIAVPGATPPLALSPDGGTLAWPARGEPAGLRILDLDSKAERQLSNVGVTPGDTLAYSPNGKWLAAVHHAAWSPIPNRCPYVYLLDAQSGRIRLRSPRSFDTRRGLAVSHDAQFLARGVDGGLQIWDLQSLEVRADVSGLRPEGARMLAFSPDDRTLVATDGPGTLVLWDVAQLTAPRSPVRTD
jgi:WD40 repeat protein